MVVFSVSVTRSQQSTTPAPDSTGGLSNQKPLTFNSTIPYDPTTDS